MKLERKGAIGDGEGRSQWQMGNHAGYDGYPLVLPAHPSFETGWHHGHDTRAAEEAAKAKRAHSYS